MNEMPLVNEMPPQTYELYVGTAYVGTYVGTACPISRVLPGFFKFIYTLTSCGIRKHEHPWGILVESSVTYEPVFLNIRGYTPISCFVQKSFHSPLHKKRYGIIIFHLGKQPLSQWEIKTQHHLKWKMWGPF